MEELIGVIDENENIVRVAQKSEIIAKNLIRRGTKILVFSSKGKLLIHKRAAALKHEPNKWNIVCGGWVSSGEKPEAAARRELAEEIGAKDIRLTFLLKYRLKYKQLSYNDISYLYRATWNKKIIPEKKEIAEIEWIDSQELDKLLQKREFTKESYFLYRNYKNRLFKNDKTKIKT